MVDRKTIRKYRGNRPRRTVAKRRKRYVKGRVSKQPKTIRKINNQHTNKRIRTKRKLRNNRRTQRGGKPSLNVFRRSGNTFNKKNTTAAAVGTTVLTSGAIAKYFTLASTLMAAGGAGLAVALLGLTGFYIKNRLTDKKKARKLFFKLYLNNYANSNLIFGESYRADPDRTLYYGDLESIPEVDINTMGIDQATINQTLDNITNNKNLGTVLINKNIKSIGLYNLENIPGNIKQMVNKDANSMVGENNLMYNIHTVFKITAHLCESLKPNDHAADYDPSSAAEGAHGANTEYDPPLKADYIDILSYKFSSDFHETKGRNLKYKRFKSLGTDQIDPEAERKYMDMYKLRYYNEGFNKVPSQGIDKPKLVELVNLYTMVLHPMRIYEDDSNYNRWYDEEIGKYIRSENFYKLLDYVSKKEGLGGVSRAGTTGFSEYDMFTDEKLLKRINEQLGEDIYDVYDPLNKENILYLQNPNLLYKNTIEHRREHPDPNNPLATRTVPVPLQDIVNHIDARCRTAPQGIVCNKDDMEAKIRRNIIYETNRYLWRRRNPNENGDIPDTVPLDPNYTIFSQSGALGNISGPGGAQDWSRAIGPTHGNGGVGYASYDNLDDEIIKQPYMRYIRSLIIKDLNAPTSVQQNNLIKFNTIDIDKNQYKSLANYQMLFRIAKDIYESLLVYYTIPDVIRPKFGKNLKSSDTQVRQDAKGQSYTSSGKYFEPSTSGESGIGINNKLLQLLKGEIKLTVDNPLETGYDIRIVSYFYKKLERANKKKQLYNNINIIPYKKLIESAGPLWFYRNSSLLLSNILLHQETLASMLKSDNRRLFKLYRKHILYTIRKNKSDNFEDDTLNESHALNLFKMLDIPYKDTSSAILDSMNENMKRTYNDDTDISGEYRDYSHDLVELYSIMNKEGVNKKVGGGIFPSSLQRNAAVALRQGGITSTGVASDIEQIANKAIIGEFDFKLDFEVDQDRLDLFKKYGNINTGFRNTLTDEDKDKYSSLIKSILLHPEINNKGYTLVIGKANHKPIESDAINKSFKDDDEEKDERSNIYATSFDSDKAMWFNKTVKEYISVSSRVENFVSSFSMALNDLHYALTSYNYVSANDEVKNIGISTGGIPNRGKLSDILSKIMFSRNVGGNKIEGMFNDSFYEKIINYYFLQNLSGQLNVVSRMNIFNNQPQAPKLLILESTPGYTLMEEQSGVSIYVYCDKLSRKNSDDDAKFDYIDLLDILGGANDGRKQQFIELMRQATQNPAEKKIQEQLKILLNNQKESHKYVRLTYESYMSQYFNPLNITYGYIRGQTRSITKYRFSHHTLIENIPDQKSLLYIAAGLMFLLPYIDEYNKNLDKFVDDLNYNTRKIYERLTAITSIDGGKRKLNNERYKDEYTELIREYNEWNKHKSEDKYPEFKIEYLINRLLGVGKEKDDNYLSKFSNINIGKTKYLKLKMNSILLNYKFNNYELDIDTLINYIRRNQPTKSDNYTQLQTVEDIHNGCSKFLLKYMELFNKKIFKTGNCNIFTTDNVYSLNSEDIEVKLSDYDRFKHVLNYIPMTNDSLLVQKKIFDPNNAVNNPRGLPQGINLGLVKSLRGRDIKALIKEFADLDKDTLNLVLIDSENKNNITLTNEICKSIIREDAIDTGKLDEYKIKNQIINNDIKIIENEVDYSINILSNMYLNVYMYNSYNIKVHTTVNNHGYNVRQADDTVTPFSNTYNNITQDKAIESYTKTTGLKGMMPDIKSLDTIYSNIFNNTLLEKCKIDRKDIDRNYDEPQDILPALDEYIYILDEDDKPFPLTSYENSLLYIFINSTIDFIKENNNKIASYNPKTLDEGSLIGDGDYPGLDMVSYYDILKNSLTQYIIKLKPHLDDINQLYDTIDTMVNKIIKQGFATFFSIDKLKNKIVTSKKSPDETVLSLGSRFKNDIIKDELVQNIKTWLRNNGYNDHTNKRGDPNGRENLEAMLYETPIYFLNKELLNDKLNPITDIIEEVVNNSVIPGDLKCEIEKYIIQFIEKLWVPEETLKGLSITHLSILEDFSIQGACFAPPTEWNGFATNGTENIIKCLTRHKERYYNRLQEQPLAGSEPLKKQQEDAQLEAARQIQALTRGRKAREMRARKAERKETEHALEEVGTIERDVSGEQDGGSPPSAQQLAAATRIQNLVRRRARREARREARRIKYWPFGDKIVTPASAGMGVTSGSATPPGTNVFTDEQMMNGNGTDPGIIERCRQIIYIFKTQRRDRAIGTTMTMLEGANLEDIANMADGDFNKDVIQYISYHLFHLATCSKKQMDKFNDIYRVYPEFKVEIINLLKVLFMNSMSAMPSIDPVLYYRSNNFEKYNDSIIKEFKDMVDDYITAIYSVSQIVQPMISYVGKNPMRQEISPDEINPLCSPNMSFGNITIQSERERTNYTTQGIDLNPQSPGPASRSQ